MLFVEEVKHIIGKSDFSDDLGLILEKPFEHLDDIIEFISEKAYDGYYDDEISTYLIGVKDVLNYIYDMPPITDLYI